MPSTPIASLVTGRLEVDGERTPIFHAASRPEGIEREATHRVLSFFEPVDVRVLVVHVSGAGKEPPEAWVIDHREGGPR